MFSPKKGEQSQCGLTSKTKSATDVISILSGDFFWTPMCHYVILISSGDFFGHQCAIDVLSILSGDFFGH